VDEVQSVDIAGLLRKDRVLPRTPSERKSENRNDHRSRDAHPRCAPLCGLDKGQNAQVTYLPDTILEGVSSCFRGAETTSLPREPGFLIPPCTPTRSRNLQVAWQSDVYRATVLLAYSARRRSSEFAAVSTDEKTGMACDTGSACR
jgi:hypothetical protein